MATSNKRRECEGSALVALTQRIEGAAEQMAKSKKRTIGVEMNRAEKSGGREEGRGVREVGK